MINNQRFEETKTMMGEGFEGFIQLFLQELQTDIDVIQTSDDFELIHLKAHSQKSSCGLLGVTKLVDIFLHIEQQAKNKIRATESINKLPNLLAEVKKIL